jgi:hypothetical protein
MRPTGFSSFACTPRLPKSWNQMALNNIHSFGAVFDLKIARQPNGKIAVNVINDGKKHIYTVNEGETVHIMLKH